MEKPLEQAVDSLNATSSAWGLDFAKLKAGFSDLSKRIEALEAENTALTARVAKLEAASAPH
jgi:cell division protein FtsB